MTDEIVEINEGTEEAINTGLVNSVPLAKVIRGPGEQSDSLLTIISPAEVLPDELDKPKIERPCYKTHDDWFDLNGSEHAPGLYFHTQNKDGEPVDLWICTPIYAIAQTSDEYATSWGLLLKFINPAGQWSEWAMPMAMLKGSGEEMRGELLHMGVRIGPHANKALQSWLANQYPIQKLLAASRTGWHLHKKGLSFVFPQQVLGNHDVKFQSDHTALNDFSTKGTVDEWKTGIASLCVGNPILLLAASSAFTGPLLKLVKLQENGGAGVHLMGDSSRGKTTALQVASSVWGSPEFLRTWRATANGLEAIAVSRNDTLLVLDECGECDPNEIGSIVYALANGLGKLRARRNGGMRQSAHWRVLILSSGECSISTHMQEGHKKIRAGQEVRLLDIPATDYQYGAFNYLHGMGDGRIFADTLKQATSNYYGVTGIKFIEALIQDNRDLPDLYAEMYEDILCNGCDGLESRAAGIFALIGYAGELATTYGLTGWPVGCAKDAAKQAFKSWRAHRGGGQTEDRRILQSIREFIVRFSDSRFSDLKHSHLETVAIKDRAGWWDDRPDSRVYLLHPAALKEAAPGFEMRRINDALIRAGWIVECDKDKRSKKVRINGREPISLYHIRPMEEE